MNSKFTFLIILLCTFSTNAQSQTIAFNWEKDSINGKLIDKIAMSVPFTIENQTYRSQFDLGANTTLIYDKCFEKTELIKSKEIRPNDFAAGHSMFVVKNQNLKIDNFEIKNYDLQGLLNFEQGEVCGVVGSDIFKDKYVTINFSKKEIEVSDKLKRKLLKQIQFVDAKYINNKLHVPIRIDDKTYYFLYDSGASIFPMITYKENMKQVIENKEIVENFNLKNFNNPLILRAVDINKNIQLGNNNFMVKQLWFTDEDYFGFKQQDIDGIIGNDFFYDKIIVLDFKNKRFGIVG
ncbi:MULTISPECIES: hypothetical protein [unclassified Kaistella]|uniref:hypothetical protein n=1 Tax=unclassified Kaistella TaxID=2762626 RepID=UPI0027327308|nr:MULTISPECIES: hypothetical protein [unclassified Kaistella]MDP2454788.1 hypothetical protein [Kaistella sp. SH11-4b]MDP2457525.1 hypothetical protein [Kaistella sp. SH40-3]MDP2460285.1 hypothetical protein [Kaistella sp. SH19-2b]